MVKKMNIFTTKTLFYEDYRYISRQTKNFNKNHLFILQIIESRSYNSITAYSPMNPTKTTKTKPKKKTQKHESVQ